MNATALQPSGPVSTLPAVQSETLAMIGMVERLARDPSIPMERIQGLMDMARDLRREQAEEAFNEAMAQTQQEIAPVARDSFNPQTRSKYASYHAVDKAIRPAYTKHGIAVSFDESDAAPEGHVRVFAIVTKGRHERRHHYDSPIVTTGMAGKTMMTLTHARASAVTYAKRYLVGMIFNLSTGEDDDGNKAGTPSAEYTPPPGSISAEQAAQIRELLESSGVAERAFLNWAKHRRIEDVPAEFFDSCVEKIEAVGSK